MSSLIEIRKKISSVQNTSKITKAMQLVASSKMKVFQKKAVHTRAYMHDFLKILKENLTADYKSTYTEKRKEGKILFVIYTSDKGLCGSLNNQLIKKLFRSEKWLNTPEDQRLLITIGRKSNDFARINKIPVVQHFKGIVEKLTIMQALPIIDEILKYWNDGTAKEVFFAAPHYKNTFVSYPILKQFLPFSEEMIESQFAEKKDLTVDNVKETDYMIYEPDKKRVMDVLYWQIVQSAFIESFFELKAAEYSSRMMAMQSATDSANKIVNNLKLTYNKTRQQVITQELAELIGGSAAIQAA